MGKIDGVTRESWILSTFPEWGTWLNEEIEQETVEPGTFAMWWLGCAGVWIKSQANTNLSVDFWCGSGKRTKKNPYIDPGHQMAKMAGNKKLQPNLRISPCVLDPFAIKNVSAVLSTHYHSDHIDVNVAAAVARNCGNQVPFIGPKYSVHIWRQWGVPAEQCHVVKPGDTIKIGDIEIVVLESFDRTALITSAPADVAAETSLSDMDDKAVNFLIKTPGGSLYHSGDSHYSNYYAKHGKDHVVDVALASYGENPAGVTDKMTASDILRMGEALNTKVLIPYHYDIWSNFQADPSEISKLYDFKKDRLQYKFKPFIWQVGGKFIFPNDRDRLVYNYPRGFDDCFTKEIDLPYLSFL